MRFQHKIGGFLQFATDSRCDCSKLLQFQQAGSDTSLFCTNHVLERPLHIIQLHREKYYSWAMGNPLKIALFSHEIIGAA